MNAKVSIEWGADVVDAALTSDARWIHRDPAAIFSQYGCLSR